MTTPALAFSVRRKGRHYPYPPADPTDLPRNQWGSVDDVPEGAVPSVTNILKVLDKPGLKFWAAEQALLELYSTGSLPLDVDTAIENHKTACNRVAGRRADAGTRAHTLAERLTADLPLPSSVSEEDEAYADAFMAFWADYEPETVAVEATLYGDGYAGTADLLAKLQAGFSSGVTVIDYKTRGERDDKKIARYGLLYDENRMQLAALAHATYLAVSDDGWRLLPVDVSAALGVVLFPDGTYATEPVEDLGRWYDAFRGALQLWRGING